MLFNSWEYVLFFLAIFVAYFSLSHKYRVYLLLVASYYFYMSWRWEFGFLMLLVSAANFYCGKKIGESKNRSVRRRWLTGAVLFSMLPVFYYKYANFFLESMGWMARQTGLGGEPLHLKIILPVGISFFTFQALSYTIDVYKNRTESEKNLAKFFTFIAFFPQLVAGPIERSTHLLRQFDDVHTFNINRLIEGSKLFIWGLFKKIVIADRLAQYADPVFNNPDAHSGSTLIMGTLFFTFQIYCDFSGYSDMAIGSARILGFRLMQNFNLPYLAHSISNFWKRWHISLSTWFGDYVYIPLGGNRVKTGYWIFNIFAVFLLSGLWHGANWTFIIWGALHAFYYLLEYIGKKLLEVLRIVQVMEAKWYKVMKIVVTFMLVAFAWIFFRANSISDALLIIRKIFWGMGQLWWGGSSVTSFLSLLLIFVLIIVQILQYNGVLALYFRPGKMPRVINWLAYAVMLIAIASLGISANAFIYFQF